MELQHYIRVVRRWWWLLILASFVGGSISFVMRLSQPDLYSSHTLITIGNFSQTLNPNPQELSTSIDLAEIYAQLVRTNTVLESTLDAVQAPLSAGGFDSLLDTYIIPNTSFLELSMSYTDPILVADLLNELANQVILASPTNLTPAQQSNIDGLNEQIESSTEEVTSLREQLSALDLQLETEDLTATQRRNLQTDRTVLIDQINATSSNIAEFTAIVTNIQNRTNSIRVLEPARIPQSPRSKGLFSAILLGAVAAGGLAFGLITLFEYLNSVFHSTDEVVEVLKMPVLGSISQYGKNNNDYEEKLLTNNLYSRILDEYRILRTNLLFASDETAGIYIVTSSAPNEGKTTTISNLAVSLSMSGLHVLLIDADIRKPQVHKVFNVDNSIGLTTLLTGKINPNSPELVVQEDNVNESHNTNASSTWQDIIKNPDKIERLWILTSGPPIENPTELLGSTIMKGWVEDIQQNLKYDVILIDTPPILGFPDGAIMSVSLGAKVIPVIRANETSHSSAKHMIKRLTQVQADIVGIILNQVNPNDEAYKQYDYYINYYSNTE